MKGRLGFIATMMALIASTNDKKTRAMAQSRIERYREPNPIFSPSKKMKINRARKLARSK